MAPAIPEAEAREIMNEILTKIKITATGFLQQVNGLKQQFAAQGQQINESDLMKHFVLPKLEPAFREAQNSVLAAYDVVEEDLEEAVTTYIANGDKELASIVDRIRKIFTSLGGDLGDSDESDEASSSKASAKGRRSQNFILTMLSSLNMVMSACPLGQPCRWNDFL